MATQHETHSIVFETSPYGNLDAIVEHDGQSVYFYLSGGRTDQQNRFGMRACWVRNLEKGPHVINSDQMQAGVAPMLPRYDCVDADLHRLPTDQTLEIVWLEEGNGAALYERVPENELKDSDSKTDPDMAARQLLAVIPPWSGIDGFHGYAANCVNQTQVCWPLPDNALLIQRLENAKAFWDAWASETTDANGKVSSTSPFALAQPKILANYRQRFNTTEEDEKYFAIDGGDFPLRGLVHYQTDGPNRGLDILATVGMSVCPQPAVEMFVDQPAQFRRIELALLMNRTGDPSVLKDVMQQISGLSGYPWQHFTWLRSGHTVAFSCGQFTAALLVEDVQGSRIADVEAVPLDTFREDPVNLLWMLPITADQLTGLENGTITADQIVSHWIES